MYFYVTAARARKMISLRCNQLAQNLGRFRNWAIEIYDFLKVIDVRWTMSYPLKTTYQPFLRKSMEKSELQYDFRAVAS